MRKFLILCLIALPGMGLAWGTASSPVELTKEEFEKIQWVIKVMGLRNDQEFWNDFNFRRGPHLIHQWIAWQAYEIVKRDPAFENSGFPDIRDINRWDGQFRVPEGVDFLPAGPTERRIERRLNEATRPELNDTAWPTESPGPDAESTRRNRWNPFYRGRAHYWNPWLRVGGAPLEAGAYYADLVDALMTEKDMREKARLACYMAHYIGDVASPKHADAIVIPDPFLDQIEKLAADFMKLESRNMAKWIGSEPVQKTKEIFKMLTRARDPFRSDQFWARVEKHIGIHPFLKSGTSVRLDVHPKSLDASIATFLESVANRPTLGGVKKPMRHFFSYFDPFYLNGEVLLPITKPVNWSFANPAGEHLYCETNTEMMRFVGRHLGNPIMPVPPSKDCAWQPNDSMFDEGTAKMARINAMSRIVMNCSEQSHGQIDWDFDFRDGVFEGALTVAVRHVAAAFRACITGLRIDARIISAGDSGKYAVKCKFTNVTDKVVNLKKALLSWDSGGVKVTPAPEASLDGKQLKFGEVVTQQWEIEVPPGSSVPEFTVDLFGLYPDIPDRGWQRAIANPGGLSIVKGAAATESKTTKGNPLDLVVVFDTSGSMKSSIQSVTDQTVEVIKRLETKCPDIRVALVEYRDFSDAEAPAMRAWEFDTPKNQIDRMVTFNAKGGGDEAEDQYAALMRAIKMKWRNHDAAGNSVTKLITVITDASAKNPDKFGNTPDKVAKAAFDVDPAHIYPIIVGSASQAIADAKEIAEKTDGEVLYASSGDQVAERLMEAVEKGIDKHAPPPPPPPAPPPKPTLPAFWYMVGGGILSLVGAAFIFGGLAKGAGGPVCPTCGTKIEPGRKFCTGCGATLES
ncbi:MAG: VWA domain-containing protein [Fimbriimonadaceae bacterium]|nr:VWA domain-containing protein [Fimbriimonadaceae bacterium]